MSIWHGNADPREQILSDVHPTRVQICTGLSNVTVLRDGEGEELLGTVMFATGETDFSVNRSRQTLRC